MMDNVSAATISRIAAEARADREARERAVFMLEREAGMTWKGIAKKHGCSRETVRKACQSAKTRPWFHVRTPNNCVFKGLRDWMNKHQVSNKDLCTAMYGSNIPRETNRISGVLRGDYRLCKDDIDAILRATGMTYEQAFGEGEA